MKSLVPSLFLILTLLFPFGASAQETRLYAGTDQYLRETVGLSEEQLTAEFGTLEREAFDLAIGEQSITDPLGDVLDANGTTSSIQKPWADIRNVEVIRNDETQTWNITITTGGIIPDVPPEKAQFLFYADRDADATNNDPDGIKIHTDAEWSIEYEAKIPSWITDFRWYNPDPVDFWAVNIETEMTYDFDGDTIQMRIPYEELSGEEDVAWRAVVAVTDVGRTQIDAVPAIGFPPPKGEVYPEAPVSHEKSSAWILYTALAALLIIAGFILWHRRTTVDKEA